MEKFVTAQTKNFMVYRPKIKLIQFQIISKDPNQTFQKAHVGSAKSYQDSRLCAQNAIRDNVDTARYMKSLRGGEESMVHPRKKKGSFVG
jgi:hypothetical protein